MKGSSIMEQDMATECRQKTSEANQEPLVRLCRLTRRRPEFHFPRFHVASVITGTLIPLGRIEGLELILARRYHSLQPATSPQHKMARYWRLSTTAYGSESDRPSARLVARASRIHG